MLVVWFHQPTKMVAKHFQGSPFLTYKFWGPSVKLQRPKMGEFSGPPKTVISPEKTLWKQAKGKSPKGSERKFFVVAPNLPICCMGLKTVSFWGGYYMMKLIFFFSESHLCNMSQSISSAPWKGSFDFGWPIFWWRFKHWLRINLLGDLTLILTIGINHQLSSINFLFMLEDMKHQNKN